METDTDIVNIVNSCGVKDCCKGASDSLIYKAIKRQLTNKSRMHRKHFIENGGTTCPFCKYTEVYGGNSRSSYRHHNMDVKDVPIGYSRKWESYIRKEQCFCDLCGNTFICVDRVEFECIDVERATDKEANIYKEILKIEES